jgi:hypothetical protein
VVVSAVVSVVGSVVVWAEGSAVVCAEGSAVGSVVVWAEGSVAAEDRFHPPCKALEAVMVEGADSGAMAVDLAVLFRKFFYFPLYLVLQSFYFDHCFR